MFDFLRRFFSKKPVNTVPATPAQGYVDVLQRLKLDCALRGSRLMQEVPSYQYLAEQCFREFRILQDQVEELTEVAESSNTWDGELGRTLEKLQSKQSMLNQQGLWYQDYSLRLNTITEYYNKTVIDLHLCIHKLRSFSPEQADLMGEDLLLAFRTRCQDLDISYQQLLYPKQLISNMPAPVAV